MVTSSKLANIKERKVECTNTYRVYCKLRTDLTKALVLGRRRRLTEEAELLGCLDRSVF